MPGRLFQPHRGLVTAARIRIIELTGINRHMAVYRALQLATDDSLRR